MRTRWKQLARYGVNGGAATLTHAVVLAWAVWAGAHPALANGGAFLTAVMVTYLGQRFWVFGAAPRSLVRFGAVVGMGLALQTGGMWVLVHLGMEVAWAWFVLTLAVPAVSYLAMKAWVFTTPSPKATAADAPTKQLPPSPVQGHEGPRPPHTLPTTTALRTAQGPQQDPLG